LPVLQKQFFSVVISKGAEMKRRKILAATATALVAAAFSGTSPAIAADGDTSVQLYGHLDLSVDDATKGLNSGRVSGGGAPLTGKMGWQSDISSNLSYFGLRGSHDIGGGNRMVFRIETQVDVAATPGLSPVTNSTTDTVRSRSEPGQRQQHQRQW